MAAVADQVTVEVLAKLDGAKRDVVAYADNFDRSMKRVEGSANRAEGVVVQSGNRQRAALQQLGIQFGDFTTQLSLGANVFQAFGAQAGQAAGAMVNFGGRVGAVAGFLAGPAGSLLIALTAVAGMMLTSANNTDKATDAKRKQGEAARNLREAIEDLDAATVQANQSSQQSTRQAITAARGFLIEATGRREAAKAAIQQAIANQQVAAGIPGAEGIDIATNIVVTGLQKQLDQINKDIADGTKKLANVGVQNIIEATEASLTATGQAARRYEQTVSSLNERLDAGQIDAAAYSAAVRQAFADAEATRNAERNGRSEAAAGRRAATAERKAERDATREAEAAERAYWSTVKAGNAALEDAATAGQKLLDERLRQAEELRTKLGPDAKGRADEKLAAGDRDFDQRMAKVTDEIQAAQAAAFDLKRDLAAGLTDAIVGADSLGDALENAFKRAAFAALESRIFDLLGGSTGGLFQSIGSLITGRPAPGRASGGNVSAGKLYRVNEGGGRGVEGFQPAGSGTVIPLGRMAAAQRGGAVTNIALTIPVDARGANDPAFTARVAQAAIRQAAPEIIETTLRAVPGRLGRAQTYEG